MQRRTCKILMGAVSVALLASAGVQANLLYNTSFEIESAFSYGFALNWKMNDPDDHGDAWGSASRENWRAHDGQFLMAIRGGWAGVGNHGGVWQETEGHAGTTYKFGAWVYADGSWTAQTQEMKIEFWNWDRSQMLGAATNAIQDAGELWARKEVIAVAPEGTEWVRVVLNVSGAGDAGSLQVDDVELVPTP